MKKTNPALPFKYIRTLDPDKADYKKWRISPTDNSEKNKNSKTNREILDMVIQEHENKKWFTSAYWREKGIPNEQIEFKIQGKTITIYNWNKNKPFTDSHLQKAKSALAELMGRFPKISAHLKWILIDDNQIKSAFGDPINYPLNGSAMRGLKAFRILPRGMEFFPHRLEKVSNFEGTFVHEATHLIRHLFEDDWSKKFAWDYCVENQNKWGIKPTPDGTTNKWFHKKTGEMSPDGQFPLQPDQCVTFYARQNISEDICESMVAYIFDREHLRQISISKLNIFQKHNSRKAKPTIKYIRIPKEKIKLPRIKSRNIYYYIHESRG